jgi:Xaa-Pro aminopeptidase
MKTDARLAGLRGRLRDDEAAAILVTAPSNMKYLTGFEDVIDDGIHGACLVTPELSRFYTDRRYVDAALEAAAAEGGLWEVVVEDEDLYVEVCADLHAAGVESLLVESSMPYGRFAFISEQFHGAVRAVDQYVAHIRQIKEPAEIERIELAAAISDAGFTSALGILEPGITEREVALELEFAMRRAGSEEMPFSIIVAAGPNGAHPHAIPGDRALVPGDLVVMDFGARVGGYCSDMTRTVSIGTATEEHRRLYNAVLHANEAGLAAVRPGVTCVEADRAARQSLVEAGLGDRFTHGLGHGVGLDVHEAPTVGRRSHESLRAGHVVTVEPGVYVPGDCGVRIEDLVVVTESGCRLLSHAPKGLIEI